MAITDSIKTSPLTSNFFRPMLDILAGAKHQRLCHEIADSDWMLLLVHRALAEPRSGRAYLNSFADLHFQTPDKSRFFEALASSRRLRLAREINVQLGALMSRCLPDPFAGFPALAAFDLLSGDGHFHEAAVHDDRDQEGKRHATGYVFLLNLRSQPMRHLDLCDALTRKEGA